jgi:hypothetical protein
MRLDPHGDDSGWHWPPPMQKLPGGHAVQEGRHASSGFTHTSPQPTSPAGHWQKPLLQIVPLSHVSPHIPQLSLSVCKLAHKHPASAEQSVSPAEQPQVQLPAVQTEPAAQTCPHAPQLTLSVPSSTQPPSHCVCPTVHASWHPASTQLVWLEQAAPHAPQLVGSSSRSTQAPLH